MRAVVYNDIIALACLLVQLPTPQRNDVIEATFEAAHIGDCIRKRLRHADPRFGDGTLCNSVEKYRHVQAAPFCENDFICCVDQIIDKIRRKYAQHKGRGAYNTP